MRYSRQHSTICVSLVDAGWNAAVGQKRGVDGREIAKSDLIVVWGGNPASTQVNLMAHIAEARRERGAKLVVVDPYRTATAEIADLHLAPLPGTDGALACAVMHVLFKEGYADRTYLARYTNDPEGLEAHLRTRTPEWAARITGIPEDRIVEFARLYGQTKRSFIRLGYGFSRSRNGAMQVFAVSCLPAVTGAWQCEGGGALYSQHGLAQLDRRLIEGSDLLDPSTRILDQSRIGSILCGDKRDLGDGPPVTALFIENTNPMVVSPDSGRVRQGFARDDLFVCVPDQFEEGVWHDCWPGFETGHFLDGFPHADRKFHFRANWAAFGRDHAQMPAFPDHVAAIDDGDHKRPFRLIPAPSRSFLNTSFNNTPSSLAREGRPTAMIHPETLAALGLADGDRVRIGNKQGSVVVHARSFEGMQPRVIIAEGLWPNHAFEEGIGINLLTSADPGLPGGGAVFHDTSVWLKPA